MVRSLAMAALAAGVVFATLSRPIRADIQVSTFEESNLAANLNGDASFEGLPLLSSEFRSGFVTFQNNGVFFGGSSWSGFGYSQRTTQGAGQEIYDRSNDLISKPATGSGGSATWAVVADNGVMTADSGYVFQSVDITSTLYTWNSMVLGDAFDDPLGKAGGTGRFTGLDDFFTVRFTNTANSQALDFNLADFRLSNSYVVGSWQPFNLSSLNASQIAISFLGSREILVDMDPDPPQYFITTPAYAALDNVTVASITAVPEPSSLCLAGLASLAIAWRRRKLLKKFSVHQSTV